MKKNNALASLPLFASFGAMISLTSVPLFGAFVQNPSFESNWNSTWPHYGSIDGWTGGSGVNDRSLDRGGPFHDNGMTPDGNRTAFKQQTGDLSQDISGLVSGQLYWIQFFYNTRGDVLSGTCDITTRFAGTDLDSVTGIQRVTAPETASTPITVPFYARSVPFIAQSDSGTLTFHVNTVGDRTALFDAVTIVARDTNDVVVMNPSFEASGTIGDGGAPVTGVITTGLAGWDMTGTVGVDVAGGTYANNGAIPNQDLAAFIQGVGSISQTIRKLVPGTQYQVSLALNATTGTSPHLSVKAGDAVVLEADLTAVGGSNAYQTKQATFTATNDTLVLTIEQTKDAQTLLLDNVRLIGATATELPPMQVSPARAELAPGQSVTISLTVPAQKLALGPADITVASSDTNLVSLVGADTNGAVVLHYDKNGTTTKTVVALGVLRGTASINVPDSAGLVVPNGVLVHVVESFVRNPSFEGEAAPGGIGAGSILAWDATGTVGINRIDQPFAANSGPIPDRLQVAFIQGAGSISQQVAGLTPGTSYWLQFCYSVRDITTPGGPAIDLNVKLGDQPLANISSIVPLSQSGATAYYFTNVVFTPTTAGGVLSFTTANPKGDSTLLLDAINIVKRTVLEIVIQNPSFEASGAMDLYIEGPNTAPLFGWDIAGGGRGTAAGGPFADNGLIPDEDEVLFLQGADTASQVLSGFTAGQKYTLIYSVNSRGCCGTPLTTHYAALVGTPGTPTILFEEDINPIGGQNPYPRHYLVFTADSAQQEIRFQHVPDGDKTLVLDDIRVVPGEVSPPLSMLISAQTDGSLLIAWPVSATGFALQSAPAVTGPWANDPAPVTVAGDQNNVSIQPSQGAKFYRLIK